MKLQELRNRKTNNKGFSLVELIIVIAIMAVLIAILAPQFIKYVERSRRSADLDTVEEYLSAIQTIAADPDEYESDFSQGGYSITLTTTKDSEITIAGDNLESDLKGLNANNGKIKSKNWKDIVITIQKDGTCQVENGKNYKAADDKKGEYNLENIYSKKEDED